MTQPPGDYPPPPPGNYPPPPPPSAGGYPPPGQGVPGAAPSNYLVLAILTTLFCCLPFGIVSIVKASSVNGLWAGGRYAESQAASASAKKWAIWSIVAAVVVYVIYGILIAAGVVTGSFDYTSS